MIENSCIFCKIITQEISTEIVAYNDTIIVIKDIAPKAPIHYLIIPKKHIKNIVSIANTDFDVSKNIFMFAQTLAAGLTGTKSFRLIINNGLDSGQSIFHLHAHFLSGKKMVDF